MSKDTLIDEARELKEKFENAALRFLETYKPDYPYDQITVMADFADKIAADAVRERDEMLGDSTVIELSGGHALIHRFSLQVWEVWRWENSEGGRVYVTHFNSLLEAYRALKAAKEGE